MNLEFHSPYYLTLLALIPLLYFIKGIKGKNASIVFSDISLARGFTSPQKSKFGGFLFFLRSLAIAAFIVALARPQMGRGESVVSSSGVDIVLAIDISGSMLALDLAKGNELTTRMDVAKEVIKTFIKKRTHDRIGIIAFAKESFLVSPMTLNQEWLLENIDRLQVGLIDPSGTAIGTAIGMSVNRLKDLKSKSRLIILLTDGANNSGKISPSLAAELALEEKTKIYTIAIGTGGVVKSLLLNKNGEYLRDMFGKVVVGEGDFDEDDGTLEKIASITNGKSFSATNRDQLRGIYGEIDKLEKSEVQLKHFERYDEIFWVPASLGLCLMFIELLLSNTRFRRLP